MEEELKKKTVLFLPELADRSLLVSPVTLAAPSVGTYSKSFHEVVKRH